MKNYHFFNPGFSLPELLLVISLIMIMSATSYPFIFRTVAHYRLSGASREIVTAIRKAQSSSVTKQYIYRVRFVQDNRTYAIIRVVDTNETTEETISLPRGISFSAINLANNQVSFTSSGFALNSGSVQIINTFGETETIEISATGQVKTSLKFTQPSYHLTLN